MSTWLGNQPRLLRPQEVRYFVVERLGLLDERHVPRVGDDDEPRSMHARTDLLGTDRSADEVVVSRDDKRRTRDRGQAGAQVKRLEDLLVEELQAVCVDRLGLQRGPITPRGRAPIGAVKRQ